MLQNVLFYVFTIFTLLSLISYLWFTTVNQLASFLINSSALPVNPLRLIKVNRAHNAEQIDQIN